MQMDSLTGRKTPVLRNNLQINDNGFVFAFDLGTTFSVNRSGIEMLKMLQQGYSKEKIMARTMELFQISGPEFEIDFQDFIVQLKNLRLIV